MILEKKTGIQNKSKMIWRTTLFLYLSFDHLFTKCQSAFPFYFLIKKTSCQLHVYSLYLSKKNHNHLLKILSNTKDRHQLIE